jgi:Mitochondrial ribosome subunit S26
MVTPENLDERIAHAFDNPVDYNFCIFMAGKRVYGRPDPLNRLNMAYTKSDLSDQPNLDRTERKVVHE